MGHKYSETHSLQNDEPQINALICLEEKVRTKRSRTVCNNGMERDGEWEPEIYAIATRKYLCSTKL